MAGRQAKLGHGTVVCPLADSYIHTPVQDTGAVAELAAARKTVKYYVLESHYIFHLSAVESLGPINGQLSRFSVVLVDGPSKFQVKLEKAAFFSSG